jgi:phosphoribosylformimino-5-aminoimidazole carboxamide ribotide isomerase
VQIIPVIDLLGGVVVRGVAGRRSEYRPIVSQIAADSRPETVARAFVEQFGFKTAYVADLDAIGGRAPNVEAWKEIGEAGLELLLDAGAGTASDCLAIHRQLTGRTLTAQIVVGLESLKNPDHERWFETRAKCQAFTFSLDLRAGKPIHRVKEWENRTAVEIARSVHARGYTTIIVLDVADVGVGGGTRTLALCKQLMDELHPVRVIAGGGVRGIEDLELLAEVRVSGVLVASALHDGRLTREDVMRMAAHDVPDGER